MLHVVAFITLVSMVLAGSIPSIKSLESLIDRCSLCEQMANDIKQKYDDSFDNVGAEEIAEDLRQECAKLIESHFLEQICEVTVTSLASPFLKKLKEGESTHNICVFARFCRD
ncbi:unnamed protein product [Dracunculus medinensis]|uniref:Saposin B-type domain-containing protein n=1 Tax=Dracunculus medinensis TaxID=318479 RepID=A0A0N4UEW7_DRAME|nr:unnamed protein product [Dracunculus medinensis]